MRTRLLFWEEDEVRKKKTLILVLAFLLIPLLLGLYAAIGPEGGLIAGATPTALPSPAAVATATPPVPTPTTMATPAATATTKATATPAATATAEATATPLSTPTSVRLEPTATPTPVSVALEPTSTPTVVPIASLTAPVITTPPDGSVLKDDRPTIAGTAPPNTTVQVYDDDGSLVGTAAADAQGDWALVADEPLETGEHTVTAVASDDTGRSSAPSVAVIFTVAIERLPVTGESSWFERWLDRLLPAAFP
ncbi:MAG: Ig-like domain repeat protein [Anaerolineales bacterium]|nr:MAG: Ig-like domain repeat protein [Anaerolineales bacterium]